MKSSSLLLFLISIPQSKENFNFLKNQGIKVIISLTENPISKIDKQILNSFILHHISIKDYTAPTIKQINKFRNLLEKYQELKFPVLVHCFAGCGRTGTFLTAYLMFSKSFNSFDEALKELRKLRPCSVETDSQINVLRLYEQQLLI